MASLSSQNLRNEVVDKRVWQFIRTQHAVRLWIEDVLEINGKLDEDLLVSLRSGVFLCYLMLELEERSIPRIQENTEHQFKQKENILFFLQAVEDYGVPKYRLFNPADLWDKKRYCFRFLFLNKLASSMS